jgi:hypothetical protein
MRIAYAPHTHHFAPAWPIFRVSLAATRVSMKPCRAVDVMAAIRPRRSPNPAPRKPNGPARGPHPNTGGWSG